MDRAHGVAQLRAPAGPRPWRQVGAVAAAGVGLRRPVEVDVVLRRRRLLAERGHQVVDDHLTSVLLGVAPGGRGVSGFEEPGDHSRPVRYVVRSGAVEGGPDDRARGDHLAGQTGRPPKRRRIDDVELDDRAAGHVGHELIAGGRQRRIEGDALGDGRRYGDDHPAGTQPPGRPHDRAARLCDAAPIRDRAGHGDGDSVVVPVPIEAEHLAVELHPSGELLGQPPGQRFEPADDPTLLGAARGVGQRAPPAGCGHVVGHVQQRQVGGGGGEHRLNAHLEQLGRSVRDVPAVDPGGQRLAVQRSGLRGLPRCVGRNGVRQRLKGGDQLEVAEQLLFGEGQCRAGHPHDGAGAHDDIVAVVVLRVGVDAQLVGQGGDAALPRPDPLPAQVEGHPRSLDGVGASAHPVARFEHDDLQARACQRPGGAQPGEPGPDNDHVGVSVGIGHRAIAATTAAMLADRSSLSGFLTNTPSARSPTSVAPRRSPFCRIGSGPMAAPTIDAWLPSVYSPPRPTISPAGTRTSSVGPSWPRTVRCEARW